MKPFSIAERRAILLGGVLLGGAAVALLLASGARAQKAGDGGAATVPSARFPAVEGKNLEGTAFTLPSGFAGKRNLVFVAFQREQQDEVDTWLPLAKELATLDKNLRFYEVPVLSRMNGMIRSFIDGGMKAGIPDKATREITITLYIDKKPFMRSLAIPDEKAIHALIIARDGSVLWRSSGKWTKEKEANLRQFIRTQQIEERLSERAK